MTRVELLYGDGTLPVDLPTDDVTIVQARPPQPLADEAAAFRAAVARPIGSAPLREAIGPGREVAIVIPDGTRPLPFERLLTWILAELDALACRSVIVLGTGSHRPNTPAELRAMMGPRIVAEREIINHSAFDAETLALAGHGPDGAPVRMNRRVLAADRRIAVGFIEPHFMAGFSGGYKAVMPGVADIDTILRYHGAQVVGDPRSAWGVLEGNPTQRIIREYGALCPVDFLVNITMTPRREITGFFCGHPIAAHEAGCAHIRDEAMVRLPRPFAVTLTCNNGFPLDQNLYQAVKGMSAAAMVTAEGGLILQAAECRDGFPSHGNFRQLLFDHPTPEALLATIEAPGFSKFDQWEAQILALLRRRARIGLLSTLPPDEVRRAYLEPVTDLGAAVRAEFDRLGRAVPVAVLPHGFATVPYLG